MINNRPLGTGRFNGSNMGEHYPIIPAGVLVESVDEKHFSFLTAVQQMEEGWF